MKKLLFVISCVLTMSVHTFAQSNWNWIFNTGGTGDDQALALTIDINGNVYVTGYFTGTVNFGGTTILNSAGDKDMFLAKINSSGVFQWAVKGGGTSADRAIDIKCDASGNIYTLGWHEGSATFGTSTLDNSNGAKTFIAKWDNNGTLLSAINIGGYGKSFVIDATNNIYLASTYSSTIKVITTSITSHGLQDLYLTKITSAGAESWVKTIWSTLGNETPIALTLTPGDSLLITGRFGSLLNFDGSTAQAANNGGATSEDLFLAKYSTAGNFVWFKQFDGSMASYDAPNSLKTDALGNIYIAGSFISTINFYSYLHTSLGSSDLFITKLSSDGNSAFWSKKEGGLSADAALSVGLDNSSNVYFTGYYSDTLTFENSFLPNTGNSDIYLAKYNSSGVFQWVKNAGGNAEDGGFGLQVLTDGSAYLCGKFSTTATFHGTPITSNGVIDLFVTKSASTFTPRAKALFTASQTTIMATSQISFTDQSEGSPNAWAWSFEGGTPDTSNIQNPTVTYNTPGTYKVTLFVSNTYGETSKLTKTSYITVTPYISPCNAAQFDGVDDYIDCGYRSSLKVNYNFTIEAWVNPAAEGGFPISFLNKTATTTNGFGLGYFNGKLRFIIQPVNLLQSAVDSMPGATIPLNQWSHVACTYDGKIASIYINGVLSESKTLASSITYLSWVTNPVAFYLGRYSDNTVFDYFNGAVDDVRIWKTTRSANEIYDNRTIQLTGSEANLAAYWNLDEGTGITANDKTANNYDGILKNNTAWVSSTNACWGLSVKNINKTEDLVIFPNPATNYFTVNELFNQNIKVVIYDITGKKVISTELFGDQNSVDVSSIHSGIFFVELISGENKVVKKLIKQ